MRNVKARVGRDGNVSLIAPRGTEPTTLQACLRVFTGTHHSASFSLRFRPPKKLAVLTMAAMIVGDGNCPQWGVASRYRAATQLIELRSEDAAGKSP